MTDNLRFRKPHMTFIDGYFYMFDDDTDMLLQKTDDGVTAFSYPFDTLVSNEILACEHDGINFWTMRPAIADGGLDSTSERIIERWRLENYICKRQESITLSDTSNTFDSEAFTVGHYHCTISGAYSSGSTVFTIKSDNDSLPGELKSGMQVTIGPNSIGQYETFDVQHVDDNVVTIADPIENTYSDDDPFTFYNYIWLFSNANGNDTSTGALYKINAYTGSIMAKYPGGVYKDILATTFAEIDHFTEFGTVNSLMYVKASNLLFVNIDSPGLPYYGSMAMDTIETDEKTIISVYDLSVYEHNLYRLQHKANYYGNTANWGLDYNYQAATFDQLVTSLALKAEPNVIPANGVSTSEITAYVKDQFLQPMPGRIVYFELKDPDPNNGAIQGPGHETADSKGKASVTFQSGSVANLIEMIARVDQ